MDFTHLLVGLFGGAIGSFFTHAFHVRANQVKIRGKIVPILNNNVGAINEASALAADAATSKIVDTIDKAPPPAA